MSRKEAMGKEKIVSIPCYKVDVEKVKSYRNANNQKNLATSMRALIAFASDRGFFA